VSGATLAFLGLSAADFAAPEPMTWTPETREMALRRLRALGGAQIRLHGADGIRGGGKNVVLCGRERTLGGGELLVEHVEWQIGRLHVVDGGDLFDRTLSAFVALDLAALAPDGGPAGDRRAATEADWPVCQEMELVSADGASVRRRVPDVRRDEPLAGVVRSLMAGVDSALRGAEPFRTRGPHIGPDIPDCFAELVRRALCASLRTERGDWFTRTLRDAAQGDLSALDRLAQPWPPTNSGVELAQGNAALFLLGAPPRSSDHFIWHRAPGQPGSRLRRLVALAAARPW
jgi:hypothetical protein